MRDAKFPIEAAHYDDEEDYEYEEDWPDEGWLAEFKESWEVFWLRLHIWWRDFKNPYRPIVFFHDGGEEKISLDITPLGMGWEHLSKTTGGWSVEEPKWWALWKRVKVRRSGVTMSTWAQAGDPFVYDGLVPFPLLKDDEPDDGTPIGRPALIMWGGQMELGYDKGE